MITTEREKHSEMTERKMVQIGIRLPEDVVRQLKVTVAVLDVTLQDYVCKAVEDHLSQDASEVESSLRLKKKARGKKRK